MSEVREPEAAGLGAVGADPPCHGCQVEDDLRLAVAEQPGRVVLVREVVVDTARDGHIVSRRLESLDEMRAEEPAAAGDERPHSTGAGDGAAQSTRPVHLSRFSAYHAIVLPHAVLPGDERLPAGFARELLEADLECEHLARAGAMALGDADDLAVARPVPCLLSHAQDEIRPVPHGDVLALPVDVDVTRRAVCGHSEVAADAVRAIAEVPQRLERPELDARPFQRLRDDRAGDEARVLPRPVVVEHPRHDTGDAEGIEVVHRQEVGGDLRRRVDGLRVERRALVEDDAAVGIELVLVSNAIAWVAVLLRRSGRVEALHLQLVVENGLEEVERADDVGHHRLVRPVPGLADVGLGAEVEDIRLVRRLLQLADEVVDRSAVGEIGELDVDSRAEVPDVVQRAARRGADEGDDIRAQLDERLRQM